MKQNKNCPAPMLHSERASEKLLSNDDGLLIFKSMIAALQKNVALST